MNLIELRELRKTYNLGDIEVPVLKGVSLTVTQGELVALMGTSGSGKSTLMNILGCLDRSTSGEYRLAGGGCVAHVRGQTGLVAKSQNRFLSFKASTSCPVPALWENVAMPLSYAAGHMSERESRRRAEEMLGRVGLADRLNHEPSQLSGGQQQRVAIARALINSPSLLFADEPTGNLDSRTSEEILRMFQRLNEKEGITIILVTHDAYVARYARRVIHIQDGLIVQGAPAADGHVATLEPEREPPQSEGNDVR